MLPPNQEIKLLLQRIQKLFLMKAQTGQVIAIIGKAHELIKQSELKKALNLIGFTDYLMVERFKKIIYLEGTTDLSMLKAFAELLNHPVRSELEHCFVKYLSNNLPDDTYRHFFDFAKLALILVDGHYDKSKTKSISDRELRTDVDRWVRITSTFRTFFINGQKER